MVYSTIGITGFNLLALSDESLLEVNNMSHLLSRKEADIIIAELVNLKTIISELELYPDINTDEFKNFIEYYKEFKLDLLKSDEPEVDLNSFFGETNLFVEKEIDLFEDDLNDFMSDISKEFNISGKELNSDNSLIAPEIFEFLSKDPELNTYKSGKFGIIEKNRFDLLKLNFDKLPKSLINLDFSDKYWIEIVEFLSRNLYKIDILIEIFDNYGEELDEVFQMSSDVNITSKYARKRLIDITNSINSRLRLDELQVKIDAIGRRIKYNPKETQPLETELVDLIEVFTGQPFTKEIKADNAKMLNVLYKICKEIDDYRYLKELFKLDTFDFYKELIRLSDTYGITGIVDKSMDIMLENISALYDDSIKHREYNKEEIKILNILRMSLFIRNKRR